MYDAVILAGGMGKRLHPVTNGYPKPLVSVGTRPVLWHILRSLERIGTKKCALTLMYEGEQIKKRFKERFGNMSLEYFTEEVPLGTAGGVKEAARLLSGDGLIVLSGDGMFDLELEQLVAFHEKSGAELTVGTHFCDDPTEYGTVISDKHGRVLAFAEKASWAGTVTGNVNTGIYVLNKSVLDLIPDGKAWDFAKDLFPLLLKEGRALYSKALSGYWCDIGNTRALLSCNADALSGKIRSDFTGKMPLGEGVHKGSIFGEGCTLKRGSCVTYSAIGDGCVIGEGASITGSLLLEGVSVPAGVSLKGCIVGANTELGTGRSYVNKAIGCAGEVKSIGSDEICFDFTDSGITLAKDAPEDAYALLGASLVRACGMGKIGILNDANELSRPAAKEIIDGAARSGARCAYDFGTGFEAQCAFAAYSYGLGVSVFVKSDGERVFIKLYDSSTAPVCREFERDVISALRSAHAPCFEQQPVRTHGLSPRYTDALIKSVYSSDTGVFSLDSLAFALKPHPRLGCVRAALSLLDAGVYTPERAKLYGEECMLADVSEDGFDLKIEYKGKTYRKELICALLAKNAAARGDKELPVSFDREPELLWADGSISIESFPSSPVDGRQVLARFNARRSLWLKDASFMLMRLAAVIKSTGRDICTLASELDGICRCERVVPCKSGRVYTMEKLIKSGGRYGKEGIVFVGEKSRVGITCNRDESLKIVTYATGTEAAEELSRQIIKKINEIL